MTDRELFESICAKYGIKKNDSYSGLMLKEDGKVRPLDRNTISDIFSFLTDDTTSFTYSKRSGFAFEEGEPEYNEVNEFLIAC